MLKTLTLMGGLVVAGLTLSPGAASAASFGSQGDVAAAATAAVEKAQYYYGGPRRFRRGPYGYRRGYYGPRRGYYGQRRGFYGGPGYYGRRAPGVYFGF